VSNFYSNLCKWNVSGTSTTAPNFTITGFSDFGYSIINKLGTRMTGTAISLRDNSQITSMIISGFSEAWNFIADIYSVSKIGTASARTRIFFKECNNIFTTASYNAYAGICFNMEILVSYKCYYLFYNRGLAPIRCNITTVYNYTPFVNYYNPSSIVKSFVNAQIGTFISIPNIYPEYQQKQSVTLANNSTDSISIADLSYNRFVELKVNMVRGTDYQTKTLKLLNTGTTFNFVQLSDSIQMGDLGVRFDGVYQSGTSNILKLKWRTTNTGDAATLVYDAYRQNF